MTEIVREKEQIQTLVASYRAAGLRVAVVPTMGGLHDGHLALVRQAAKTADRIILTIYVNPTQFAAHEDLDSYPRQLEADRAACEALGLVDAIYAPLVMYHDAHATMVTPTGAAAMLEGEARPHFFTGVATIVLKLFHHVPADEAFFGEKDYQQLCVIRQMVRDLDVPIQIVAVPTERAPDGLALSSRNTYLSEDERAIAPQLYQAMRQAAHDLLSGAETGEVLDKMESSLTGAGFATIDYIALRDPVTLADAAIVTSDTRLLVAAHLGKTRLIDNAALSDLVPR